MAIIQNPLLQDFIFPPYDVIKADHVRTGIQSLLIKLENELVKLENEVEPTWPKLVVPLEKITDRLSIVWGIVNHLNSVKDSTELRDVIAEIQPKKVEFQLRLRQSKPIYEAFKAIRTSSDWVNLNGSRKRVVEMKLKEAIMCGVSLEDIERERFNEIEQELEKLAQKFEENILDATKNFHKLVTDRKEIEGLTLTTLAMAAEMAISKGYEKATAEDGPWVITLDGPIYRSILQHACNRSLREDVYRAYVTRASDGPLNNTPIMERILELRLEKAKLLGHSSYAELSFEAKMDMEDLREFARARGAKEANNLNHWDINFWSERLRESKYDLNEEDLRPFLSLPKVMDGLFNLTKKLFDIDIQPSNGMAPVWSKDVSFYTVTDSLGTPIAYFYFDPYTRPSEKRGGAWMDVVVGRSSVLSSDDICPRLPVAHIVCNQTPPTGDKPSLMTIREVEAVFHEFGHALQHMLTKQDEGFVSGNQGIEWDAVEIPSLFMENWCYQRKTIMGIAKHYETEETLPEDTCLRLLAARTYRAGSQLLRQLRYAEVDLELHSRYVPGGPGSSIYDIDQKIGTKTHPIPLLREDRFLCSFSHIFADKYAAGYYSYQWAEVLSADAFLTFEEAGLDNDQVRTFTTLRQSLREMGYKFRDTILALGGGKSPNEVFMEFRGREPTPDAFLRYNGLLPAIA
ncbi:hypothetical protein OROGR_002620 [Orobanche gracilis]